MSNIDQVDADILVNDVPNANEAVKMIESLHASRKLHSSRQSPSGIRHSAATEMTPGEGTGSPRSDSKNSSPSQKSNKKRKLEDISNTDGAATEAGGASCSESNGEV